jgi:DnaK suppressor protein
MTACVSHEDLPYFERRLRARRDELQAEINAIRARKRNESFTRIAGEAPDIADASLATIAVDTENAGIRRDENELRQIDEALVRVAAGTYGVCLRCGECLERARLEAYPAARRHSPCQEAHDKEAKLARGIE